MFLDFFLIIFNAIRLDIVSRVFPDFEITKNKIF